MDISLVPTEENNNTTFDIEYLEGDFIQDDLDTSVEIALFGDARADESEVLTSDQRRGFWGKVIDDVETGGKIWLQDGRKTVENLSRILDFTEKTLAFLVNEGLEKRVESNAVFISEGIALFIEITRLDNSTITKKYVV